MTKEKQYEKSRRRWKKVDTRVLPESILQCELCEKREKKTRQFTISLPKQKEVHLPRDRVDLKM